MASLTNWSLKGPSEIGPSASGIPQPSSRSGSTCKQGGWTDPWRVRNRGNRGGLFVAHDSRSHDALRTRMRMPASCCDCLQQQPARWWPRTCTEARGAACSLDVAGEPVKPDALMAVAASMLKRRRIESRGENAGKKSFCREIIITDTTHTVERSLERNHSFNPEKREVSSVPLSIQQPQSRLLPQNTQLEYMIDPEKSGPYLRNKRLRILQSRARCRSVCSSHRHRGRRRRRRSSIRSIPRSSWPSSPPLVNTDHILPAA